MKIFMLIPEMPYPSNTGGRIGVMKRIEYLSKDNDIYLFGIVDSADEINNKQFLLNYCKEVYLYNRSERKIISLLTSVCSLKPYGCVSRTHPQMKKKITSLYNLVQPDAVLVEFPQMIENLNDEILNSGKCIMDEHNIEYVTINDLSKGACGLKRILYRIESSNMRRYERSKYLHIPFALYTFVSISDKAFFEKEYKKSNTALVPVGTEIFTPTLPPADEYNVMYFGKMSYPANIDAAVWFVNKVFPGIKQSIPKIKFYIVGKDPTLEVIKLGEKDRNIIITGTVESVAEYYDRANLVVIPLFYGGGVKVKLLEALGRGKLVITTDKGIEGTNFKGDEHLITANTPEEFVDKCIDALTMPDKYSNIAIEGRKTVMDNLSWESVVNQYLKDIKSAL